VAQILLGFSVFGLLAVALLVGGRLLLLARRTRRLPELCIGMGFYLNAVFGHPLMAWSGWGGSRVADVSVAAFGVGSLLVGAGMTFLYVFTWRVFRPGEAWAAGLTAVASLAFVAQAVGMTHALATAGADARPHDVTAAWATFQHVMVGLCLAWTGLESLLFHRQMRRRLALGLADPVLTNRFLLWAVFGVTTTAVLVVNAVYHLAGISTLNNPVCQLVTILGALVASGAMSLAFIPPAAYLRLIERRTRPAEA
jgi:hypothetical protein